MCRRHLEHIKTEFTHTASGVPCRTIREIWQWHHLIGVIRAWEVIGSIGVRERLQHAGVPVKMSSAAHWDITRSTSVRHLECIRSPSRATQLISSSSHLGYQGSRGSRVDLRQCAGDFCIFLVTLGPYVPCGALLHNTKGEL